MKSDTKLSFFETEVCDTLFVDALGCFEMLLDFDRFKYTERWFKMSHRVRLVTATSLRLVTAISRWERTTAGRPQRGDEWSGAAMHFDNVMFKA